MKSACIALVFAASTVLAQEVPPPPVGAQTPAPLGSPSPSAAIDPEVRVVKAVPVGERELATRLQIFLDNKGFGPGKIDGRPKEFTMKALARYEKANNLPGTGAMEEGRSLPLDSIDPIYTQYTITPEDQNRIGDVPSGPEAQSKLKKLPYPSLLKFVAERYHADPDFLARINRGKNLEALAAGDTIFVPNVPPFKIETVKEIGKLPPVPEFKTRELRINTKEKMLDLVDVKGGGEKLLASFPITPGSASLPAPVGKWRILGIATLPWFRHDEGVLMHGVRTDHFFNIPSGPSNPVGVLWCGLNKPGIGVHGTNSPWTIGRAGSHGCIRLANWDAIRLANMITEGMTVIIDDGNGLPAPTPAASSATASVKVSSNSALTEAPGAATKNVPQIPGRETTYANH
ncbi:MAG: L,D-transpeptidase family protein [Chthoniobacteraceae bacterium]